MDFRSSQVFIMNKADNNVDGVVSGVTRISIRWWRSQERRNSIGRKAATWSCAILWAHVS
jgi:hypothetical protein